MEVQAVWSIPKEMHCILATHTPYLSQLSWPVWHGFLTNTAKHVDILGDALGLGAMTCQTGLFFYPSGW